jgi:electron transport complex protein RnfB
MHTVLTAECSGCELCLPACPVDCIDLVPAVDDGLAPDRRAAQYRARFLARRARLARLEAERQAELAARKASLGAEAVRAAIARARERQRGDET